MHCKCRLSGPSGHRFSDPLRKCFSYFLLGRLRFCDDVASRRFALAVAHDRPAGLDDVPDPAQAAKTGTAGMAAGSIGVGDRVAIDRDEVRREAGPDRAGHAGQAERLGRVGRDRPDGPPRVEAQEARVDLRAAGDRVERDDRHAHAHPADEPDTTVGHVAHEPEPRLELARHVRQRPVIEGRQRRSAGGVVRLVELDLADRRIHPDAAGRDPVGDGRVVRVRLVADRVVGPPHAAVDDRVDAGLGGTGVADRGQRVGQDRQPQPVRLGRRPRPGSRRRIAASAGWRSACSHRPTPSA